MNPELLKLYAITDRTWAHEHSFIEQVEAALQGGVSILQMREKHLSKEELFEEALLLKNLCMRYDVPFIINDNVMLAREIDADGVHIGPNDMELTKARYILGKGKIIGVSARSVEAAIIAENNGADYLGAGAMFTTNTKKDAQNMSIATLQNICQAVKIPVVAIGGISLENAPLLKGTGIAGIAVVSAIFSAENIKKQTKKLKRIAETL